MSSSFTLFSQRHLHIVSFVARLTIGFSLTSVAEVWFTGTAISSLSMGREVLRGQISLKTVEFVRSLPSFSSSPSFSAFPPLEVTKMVQITRARQQRPIQVITTVFFLKPKHGPSSAILAQNGGPSEKKALVLTSTSYLSYVDSILFSVDKNNDSSSGIESWWWAEPFIKVWVSEKCSKKYSKKHSKKFYLLKKRLKKVNALF